MTFKKTFKLQSGQKPSIFSYCLFVIFDMLPLSLLTLAASFYCGPPWTFFLDIVKYNNRIWNKRSKNPLLQRYCYITTKYGKFTNSMMLQLHLHRLNFIKFDKQGVYKEPTISTMFHVTFSRLVIQESQPTVNRQCLYCTLLFLASTTFAITVSTIK